MEEKRDHNSQLSPLKQAFLKLEEMEERLRASEHLRTEPIAVIGIGCRLPGGASSAEEYWQLLKNGVDAVGEVPSDRWDIDDYYDPNPDTPGKMATRYGAFLEGIDKFDARCFGISPREAASMDPQQRLLLEVSWEALEHAAQAPDKLAGSKTGVYVGLCTNDYEILRMRHVGASAIDAHYASGIAHSIASGRLSYFLGTKGPSMAIDTACSSSLVAVHLACQSLRSGEIDMALAGGVNVIIAPENTIALSRAGMMAKDGRCKTFDDTADGFVRGEGCAVVVLKRESDALKNGDPILALIRGSAINHDGASSGLTVPSGPAQEAVIRKALESAGVDPLEVHYVECHGTGTSLGDPIEVQALNKVYGMGRAADAPLVIGSVKTNIGHLEAAAGIAGLIKVVLALYYRQIPAHLHLTRPNTHIAWQEMPLRIVTKCTDWPQAEVAGRGAVSAFGFSGTNTHVVLQESPQLERKPLLTTKERSTHILCLSAMDKGALEDLRVRYIELLGRQSEAHIGDLCFSANAGRKHFKQRLSVIGATAERLHRNLAAVPGDVAHSGVYQGDIDSDDPPKVAFVFTGQGSQYTGMGQSLYESQSVFRGAMDLCNEILDRSLDPPLLEVLFPPAGQLELIHQTIYTQPALFALEYALAALWKSWGISPSIVMGHSVGEYVAACIAGLFSLKDALMLVAERGRLIEMTPEGAMAAVFAEVAQVQEILGAYGNQVSVAAVNGSASVVISGVPLVVADVLRQLDSMGITYHRLNVKRAFHSGLLSPILDSFEAAAGRVDFAQPQLTLISNLTGELAEPVQIMSPGYWRQHLQQPVCFFKAIRTLMRARPKVVLEIGPSPTLIGMASQCLTADDSPPLWLTSLRKGKDESQQMLESLGELYCIGADINWESFDHDFNRRRLHLPTYPFRRKHYWAVGLEPADRARMEQCFINGAEKRIHPLLGRCTRSPLVAEILFENQFNVDSFRFFKEHRVFGEVVVPATAFLEMAISASKIVFGESVFDLEDVTIQSPLILYDGQTRYVQTVIAPMADANAPMVRASFKIGSFDGAAEDPRATWQLHVEGRIVQGVSVRPPAVDNTLGPACRENVDPQRFYDNLFYRGMDFGASFRGMIQLDRCDGEALGKIRPPETIRAETEAYWVHPAILDACLQTFAASRFGVEALKDGDFIYMPIGLERLSFYRQPQGDLISHFKLRPGGSENTVVGDAIVSDGMGGLVARIEGLIFRKVDHAKLSRQRSVTTGHFDDWMYREEWIDVTPNRPSEAVITTADGASIKEIEESLEASYGEVVGQEGFRVYNVMLPELDKLCTHYICQAMRKLGWSLEQSAGPIRETDLFTELLIAPRHRRLFRRFLDILAEDGILRLHDGQWEVGPVPDDIDTHAWMAELLARYPEGTAELSLLNNCGEKIAENLRRNDDPLETLFPDGSFALADQLYRHSPAARVMNLMIRKTVQKVVAEWKILRPIRILEIGGGTGGTTSCVVPILTGNRVEYFFTDISPLFISRAEDEFRQFPFMRYQVLDIESDSEALRLETNSVDVIIAANVLHATTRLSSTLANVRSLLKPGGLLVLLEGTKPLRWIDLTFGFTEGWWRFSDREVRTDYPLVDRQIWTSLLKTAGFHDVVTTLPDRHDGPLALNSLILAQVSHTDQNIEPAKIDEGKPIWILLTDHEGLSEAVAERLRSTGHVCVTVTTGDTYSVQDQNHFTLNPVLPEDYKKLISAVSGQNRHSAIHILHLLSVQQSLEHYLSADRIMELQNLGTRSILYLTQALALDGVIDRTNLWIFTRGVRNVISTQAPILIPHATVWGLAKTIILEHPEMQCICVDLDPSEGADHIQAIMDSLNTQNEGEIAYREGRRFVARLRRVPADVLTNGSSGIEQPLPQQLVVEQPGTPDSLRFKTMDKKHAGKDEVIIRVKATGLNFRDVLIALDMYPGGPAPIGGECSGIIHTVGPNISHLKIGDKVIALAPSSFDSFAVADSRLVVKKPDDMSFEDAATVLSGYLTAYYCLTHLAKLMAKERILIHAATGGVGLSAVYLARQIGADIFATAGSQHKRDFLRSLGISHVYDSRSLEFAKEIMESTDGQGIDVVLNSLAGDFIQKSLEVLRRGGRYIEIGKREVWDEGCVHQFRKDVSYHLVDLAEISLREPDLVGSILRQIMHWIEKSELPTLPKTTFTSERVTDAFRYMMQAKHIGKIVVVRGNQKRGVTSEATTLSGNNGLVIRPDGTYLITGGLGGIGLKTVSWLAAKGAKHLVVMGRTAGSLTRSDVQELQQSGTIVRIVQGDVTKEVDVNRVMDMICNEMPPLKGIIHSAGVLEDGALIRQTWSRFESVLAPKVIGAWHLHQLTSGCSLDFFVLFSSIASLLGSRGQGNHAAANAFLDGLAHLRRMQGLPALSINWGAWTVIGAAARHNVESRIRLQGIGSFSPDEGLIVLGKLLSSNLVQVGVMPVNWHVFLRQYPHGNGGAYYSAFHSKDNGLSSRDTPGEGKQSAPAVFMDELEKAPEHKWEQLIRSHIRKLAEKVLAMGEEDTIEDDRPLHELGMDSLMAVELRNLMKSSLRLEKALAATLVFDYPTISELTEYIYNRFAESKGMISTKPETGKTAARQEGPTPLDEVEQLSDDEVDRILADRTKQWS
jgi:acyl transferase domain-containing protein/ubiquinone/menaquinone biosynthesis C-methylase UbiE/acyl carrier protein